MNASGTVKATIGKKQVIVHYRNGLLTRVSAPGDAREITQHISRRQLARLQNIVDEAHAPAKP